MPTYVCAAAAGRLTPVQKSEIVRHITAIHHEETGAPRYLVQVIFYDVALDSHYVGGRLAPDQIWVRADVRSGWTNEQKGRMLRRKMQDRGGGGAAAEDTVWVYLCEIPAANMAEYAHVLPAHGHEDAWVSVLPAPIKEK